MIFGLPFRDHIWSTNVFFALQGLQDDAWLQSPKWRHYGDVRREMQIKQLTTSVIQAINRIRCRRVIDADGNCPVSEVFIALPDTLEGDSILQNLTCEMPGIDVQPWDFAMDGDAAKVRRGSSHAALVAFMSNRLPGETTMTQVRKELGMSAVTLDKVRRALREPEHVLTKALASFGVRYVTEGAGRGSRAYLVKVDLIQQGSQAFVTDRQAPDAESFGFAVAAKAAA